MTHFETPDLQQRSGAEAGHVQEHGRWTRLQRWGLKMRHKPTFESRSVYCDLIAKLDPAKVPRHVAIIMDGNRRWARKSSLPALAGHWEGAEILIDLVRFAALAGVKVLTVYAFSTENWARSQEEIDALMHLYEVYLTSKRQFMVEEGVRLGAIGDLSRLPDGVKQAFQETAEATRECQKIHLVLAINYGSRDEILRAVKKILRDRDQGKIAPEELTEGAFAGYLDTHSWGDPELLIRTSGELRVSNFLLWQISYAELYVTDVLWPEFTAKEFTDALLSYQERQRRQGG